jgi:hypothetical protein
MAQPPCKKCKKAGLECFEKRPLRWAEGATYRGKMGTLSAKNASVPSTAASGNSRTTSKRGGQTLTKSRNQSTIVGTDPKGNYSSFTSHDGALVGAPQWDVSVNNETITNGIAMDDAEASEPIRLRIPSSLDDPSIIGLERTSRYYLYYCKSGIVQVALRTVPEQSLTLTQIANVYASCSSCMTATGTL